VSGPDQTVPPRPTPDRSAVNPSTLDQPDVLDLPELPELPEQMRIRRAKRDRLLAAGRSPDTPVGVFAKVTRPDAQAAVGTLGELPDLIRRIDGGPAILIIGDVIAHSAPWRQQNLSQTIAQLLEPA
jgi:hypothetical protein